MSAPPDSMTFDLAAFGCGTAGHWVLHALVRSPVVGDLVRRVVLIDKDRIETKNLITCPAYAGAVGEWKASALARLVWRWSRRRVIHHRDTENAENGIPRGCDSYAISRKSFPLCPLCLRGEDPVNGSGLEVQSLVCDMETGSWRTALPADGGPLVGLICLDDWGARLATIEGLRQWTSERPAARCSTIQVGVNRDPDQRFGAASVACFGSRWNDPCPACGMTCLPEPEPCVVFDDLGRPVRGNLWREAHAAGRLAARMVCDWLSGATNWTNTKSLVHAANPGARRTDLLTYRVSRYAGCLGPHRPSVRWDSMLLNALGIEQGGNDVR